MLETLFRFLFEYRPVVFQQGEFRFAPTTGSYVALALAIAAGLLIVISYRARLNAAPPATLTPIRASFVTRNAAPLLLGLRLALIALVALCLFRPVMVVKAAAPLPPQQAPSSKHPSAQQSSVQSRHTLDPGRVRVR